MKDSEKNDLYNAIDSNKIIKSEKKYSMSGKEYYLNTVYSFGKYKIESIFWSESCCFVQRERLRVWKNGLYIDGWNETLPDCNYVRDMYNRVKNACAIQTNKQKS